MIYYLFYILKSWIFDFLPQLENAWANPLKLSDRIIALLPDHLTLYYVQALFYSLEAVNLTVSSVQLHFLRPDSILQLGSREPYGFTNGALIQVRLYIQFCLKQ